MRILAIDTSCGAASVAVCDGDSRETLARESVVMKQGHAEALAPMTERLVNAAGGGFGSIGRIAVGIGPGSFTGIRVGLAMARAIGLTLEIPVVGVSTLVAFVGPLLERNLSGVIASVVDARHGHVYFQLFEARGRPILAPRVTSLREAVRLIGGGPARAAGNAAGLLADEAQRAGVEVDASEAADFPDIVALARIGLAVDPASWPARPLYVKAPDAHPSSGDSVARVDG
jgi:tRNA threonylcarbamoyl adenosine modification protein YeaZ